MADTDTPPQQQQIPNLDELLRGLLTPQQVPQAQPVDTADTRPSWIARLGETLTGGPPADVQMTQAQREVAGHRALINAGIGMMSAGPFASLGQGIAQGLLNAQASEYGSEGLAAQRQVSAQDWQQQQTQNRLEALKTAIPLLQTQLQLQQAAAAKNLLLGRAGAGSPGTTPGTSLATPGLTGDINKDRQIIAQRESGGDPTALNYVARADPTAYARGATASGKYQFVNSTWREGMQLAGLDPSQYPTAMSAPEAVQDKVFDAVYNKYGTRPWDPSQWKQTWVPTPTGQFILATAAKPAADGKAPAAPPAGAAAPPAEPPAKDTKTAAAPPSALPVPPVPPSGAVPTITTPEEASATAKATGQAQPVPGAPALWAKPEGGVTGTPPRTIFPGVQVAGPGAPPATVTPPATPTPQTTTQQPPPPAPTVTPPATPPAPSAEPTYTYTRQPLPPDIQAHIANPLTPEQLAPYDAAIASAVTVQEAQAAAQAKNAAIAAERAKYVEQGEAWQKDEAARGLDVWKTNQAAKNKLAEINAQSDATASTKALQDINESGQGAQNTLALLGLARQLSAVSGTASFDQLWPNLANNMARAGLLTPEEIQQIGAQRSFDAVMNKLVLAARQGTGMSRISNMDLQFLQNTAPTSFTPEQIRTPMLAALESVYQRQLQYAHLVNAMHGSGMPVWQAEQEADKQLPSVLKQPPAFENIQDPNARLEAQGNWVNQNVPAGSFYLKPDGKLAIRGQPRQPQQQQ